MGVFDILHRRAGVAWRSVRFSLRPVMMVLQASDMDSYLEISTYREYVLFFAESTDTLQRSALCNSCAEILLPYLTLPSSYKHP